MDAGAIPISQAAANAAQAASPADVVEAARALNGRTQAASATEEAINNLHDRVLALENALDVIVPVLAKLCPALAPFAEGLVEAAKVADDATTQAEAHAAMLARVAEFFETHLKGKF